MKFAAVKQGNYADVLLMARYKNISIGSSWRGAKRRGHPGVLPHRLDCHAFGSQ